VPLAARAVGFINVYTDPDGYSCYLPIAPLTPTTCYVLAYNDGGFTGAEFGIQGWEDPFLVTATPSPDITVSVGEPIQQHLGATWVGGTDIAFASCQASASPRVLFTLTVFNPTAAPSYPIIRVRAHSSPTNPNFACPLVTLCNPPVFTAQCISGGSTHVVQTPIWLAPNSPTPADGATEVTSPILRWQGAGPFLAVCESHDFMSVFDIYFGTTPDPPLLVPHCLFECQQPGYLQYCCPVLAPQTQYYWRIVEHQGDGFPTEPSPVWTFTTGAHPVAVQESTWSGLKELYR
jgi:hypothetical protein